MRKVPLVFCLLRNPQPLLPKIWKLHPSSHYTTVTIARLAMNVNFPTPWITPTRILESHCHLKDGSCLSTVLETYHGLQPRPITDTQVQIQWNPGKHDLCLETSWRGTTKSVVPRDCSRCVGSHSVEYGTEISLLPMCMWCLCVSPGNFNVLCAWLVLNIGAGIFTFLNI